MTAIGQLDSDRYASALVTGASSGIGLAVAQQLQEFGIRVYGTSRHPDKDSPPDSISWLRFDGSSMEGVKDFVKRNHQLLTYIDILINNAGSSFFGKASEIPEEVKSQQQCLLLESPKQLCESVLEGMLKRNRGAIINVSSLAALFKIPYMEAYSRSKAELSDYTRQLIESHKGTGLVIIDFQPGDYRTEFNNNLVRYGGRTKASDRVWKQLEKNLRGAPPPERAARDICAAIARGRSATVRSGTFFQSKLAPAARLLLPEAVTDWAIRKYFRVP